MALFTRILNGTIKNSFTNGIKFLSTQKVTNVTPLNVPQFLIGNHWIYQQNEHIRPPIHHIKIDIPKGFNYQPSLIEPIKDVTIEAPSAVNTDIAKEAARLIVIRRKKMKRHKLRKLRKRMRFEWAKRRQRRELKKEKDFQAVLIKQCKEAEGFSAERYVEERLHELNKEVIPRYWNGRRLPEFIIREKLGLPPK